MKLIWDTSLVRTKRAFFGPRRALAFQVNFELERTPFKPGRGSVMSRASLERTTVQILDAQTDPEYGLSKAQKLGGYCTMIGTPHIFQGAAEIHAGVIARGLLVDRKSRSVVLMAGA